MIFLYASPTIAHNAIIRNPSSASFVSNNPLVHDADPDYARPSDGGTAAHLAASHENTDAIRVLHNYKADLNVKTRENGDTPLFVACREDDKKTLKALIDCDADVNALNNDKQSAISVSTKLGYIEIVELLLKNKARLDIAEEELFPFTFAVANGEIAIAKFFLENGVDINQVNNHEYHPTALHMVCETDGIEHAKWLIENGAKANIDPVGGVPFLTGLLYEEKYEMAELVLENGANVDPPLGGNYPIQDSPLYWVCKAGNEEWVQKLLNRGADKSRFYSGMNSLLVACSEGHTKVAVLLINEVADVRGVYNDFGWSCLMLACWSGNVGMVQIILNYDTDVDYKPENGPTALILACESNCYEAVELMVSVGAEVDVVSDIDEEIPLIHSVLLERFESVKALVENDADPNIKSEHHSPLTHACIKGFQDIALALLEAGAEPSEPNQVDGSTPLMLACQSASPRIVDKLLEFKVDVLQTRKKDGITALHVSAAQAQIEILDKLIKKSSKPSVKSFDGVTPLMVAGSHGHTDILEYLIDKQQVPVNERDNNGTSALWYAKINQNSDAFVFLKSRGAKFTLRENGRYLFAKALGIVVAFISFFSLKQKFYDKAADEIINNNLSMFRKNLEFLKVFNGVDEIDIDGNTLLHGAVFQNRPNMIELLLDQGASILIKNNEGETACSLANEIGNHEIVRLIQPEYDRQVKIAKAQEADVDSLTDDGDSSENEPRSSKYDSYYFPAQDNETKKTDS